MIRHIENRRFAIGITRAIAVFCCTIMLTGMASGQAPRVLIETHNPRHVTTTNGAYLFAEDDSQNRYLISSCQLVEDECGQVCARLGKKLLKFDPAITITSDCEGYLILQDGGVRSYSRSDKNILETNGTFVAAFSRQAPLLKQVAPGILAVENNIVSTYAFDRSNSCILQGVIESTVLEEPKAEPKKAQEKATERRCLCGKVKPRRAKMWISLNTDSRHEKVEMNADEPVTAPRSRFRLHPITVVATLIELATLIYCQRIANSQLIFGGGIVEAISTLGWPLDAIERAELSSLVVGPTMPQYHEIIDVQNVGCTIVNGLVAIAISVCLAITIETRLRSKRPLQVTLSGIMLFIAVIAVLLTCEIWFRTVAYKLRGAGVPVSFLLFDEELPWPLRIIVLCGIAATVIQAARAAVNLMNRIVHRMADAKSLTFSTD